MAAIKPIQTSTVLVSAGKGDPAKASKRDIMRFNETVILGKIQKPEAFYILQRSNLSYESLTLKKSFIPKILDSVKKEPF